MVYFQLSILLYLVSLLSFSLLLFLPPSVMNPQSGLRIRAYKKAAENRATDRELLYLTSYLHLLNKLDDFSGLDHREWREYLLGNRQSPSLFLSLSCSFACPC